MDLPTDSHLLPPPLGSARFFLVAGALLACTAVAAGAFGAHGLRGRLDPRMMEIFETAARYQLAHGVALVVTGIWMALWPGRAVRLAGVGFVAGALIFSGSLYALSLSGVRGFGAITPLGGAGFLFGWLALAWAGVRVGCARR